MFRSFRPRSLLTAAILALASLPALAMQPFQAHYQADYMGLQADGLMTLAHETGGQWRYTLTIRNALANLMQSTTFEEVGGQLRPLSGHDSSAAFFKKKSVQAHYDWSSRQATWSGDIKPNRRGPVALEPGDLDALLINLVIARDLQAGKPLNYRMVDDGRVKPMTYRVVGKETLTVNGKAEQATKVARKDGDKELIAWIVPDLPVPAKLLQREHGRDTLSLTIRSLQ